MTTYKQERPTWCPHKDCLFKRRVMDNACCGDLPEPVEHDGAMNTYRMCLNGVLPDDEVFDLQMYDADLDWLRWLFDALDGKKTSGLSLLRDEEWGDLLSKEGKADAD